MLYIRQRNNINTNMCPEESRMTEIDMCLKVGVSRSLSTINV